MFILCTPAPSNVSAHEAALRFTAPRVQLGEAATSIFIYVSGARTAH